MTRSSDALWLIIYRRVQAMIGKALRDYRPVLHQAEGEVPAGSLPPTGNTGNGYTPVPADSTTVGGVTLAGDLSGGTADVPVVSGLRGVVLAAGAPISGEAYVFNGTEFTLQDIATATEVINAIAAHAANVASPTILGHVKYDDVTIKLNGSNQLYALGGDGGGGYPPPPDTYAYIVDSDGAYLVDSDGAYLYEVNA